ncbi:RNA polymerase sigma-70 factor [Phytomonospora sp. NPDC050363]|uniref:RNA polymerase sigma-70 factor n=1 Tax=Phytomonospora sp. NPDC050363 TaxID=3155642 RepID=UPI003400735A
MATATELFEEHRNLLFSVAYRMLGSVADAEDAVQDSWLRWSTVDVSTVEYPKAYLVRVVSTTALNRMRTAKARREAYVGPWLPEPLLTSPDVAEEVEMAESVSLAMLVVLETLGPDERAVFVLREVFGYPHAQIAEALDKSEAAVRQLAHRARSHVQARRPRFEADRAKQKEATERFLAATMDGDLESLMGVLAPDVTLVTDGGGRIQAARNPIHGADKVARFLLGVTSRPWAGIPIEELTYGFADLNGAFSLLVYHHGKPVSTLTVDVADGRIAGVQMVANPEKLRHLPKQEG